MSYYVYDLVIGLVLLLFALRGRKKGLILALCSLAAIITAYIGASYISDALTPKAAEIITPKISSLMENRLSGLDIFGLASQDDAADDQDTAEASERAAEQEQSESDSEQAETEADGSGSSGISIEQVQEAISALKLPSGMLSSIENALGSLENIHIGDLPSALSDTLARAAAETLLHLVIFIFSFLIIMLFWRVIGHALDLVARLPVLHFLNKTGGFIFGLCKGGLLLFVLAWILRYLGNIVPDNAVEHTYLLHFFMTTDPLQYIKGA